ncbi:MAG: Signal transduction histidine kinase [Rhodobacteraceae bacterium HLUCCA12]|nr:MAG: Signal transduction histidine kinase [Rhodobacteraceae bacterium HLUCCA12]
MQLSPSAMSLAQRTIRLIFAHLTCSFWEFGLRNSPEGVSTHMNGDQSDDGGLISRISSNPEMSEKIPRHLRENPFALRNFVQQAPIALAMFDRQMRYVAVSRSWTELFETGDSESPGRSHYDVFPDLPDFWRDAHQRGLKGEHLSQAEARWVDSSGTVSWHRWELGPWRDENDEIGGIVLFMENITGPKTIDAILRLISVDAVGQEFPVFARHATRRLSEILGAEIVQLAVPDEAAPDWLETVAVFADGRAVPNYSYRLAGTPCKVTMARGTCLYNARVRASYGDVGGLGLDEIDAYAGTTLLDSKGEVLGVLSIMRRSPFRNVKMVRGALSLAGVGIGGLLESHRAMDTIRASEQFSRSLLDTMNSHVAVLDRSGEIIFANSAWFDFARINGASEQSVSIGTNYLDVCDSAASASTEAAQAARLLREVLSGQRSEGSFEYSCPTPKGVTWYVCTVKSFSNAARPLFLIVHENVTTIKQAHRQREQVELKFRRLFESAPDAALIADCKGAVVLANRQAAQMFGHEIDSMEGLALRTLIHEEGADADGIMDRLMDQLRRSADGTAWGTVLATRRDGDHFPAEISVSQFTEDDETRFIVSLRDISLRLAAEADRLARTSAEQANQAKSIFLATMSHEIRTPLNAVLGFAEVLSHSRLDSDQAGLLQHMRSSAQHLLGLIDNVLDLSKIEANELTIERERFDLPALILDNARVLGGFALQRNVRISLFIDPALPRLVVGDPSRLRQVVYNLLGNAIKFSAGHDGQGHVKLRARMTGATTPTLDLSFEDNGIGMTEAVRARIFQPFVQGEESITRRFGGTGLGLTITRRIVEKMEGAITLDSAPGRGSTFRVSLPLEGTSEPAEARPPRLSGLHCLIVESTVYPSDDLALYLHHEGARVTRLPSAGSGASPPVFTDADVVIAAPDGTDHPALPSDVPEVLICDPRHTETDAAQGTCLRPDLLTCDSLVKAVNRACGLGLRATQDSQRPATTDAGTRFDARCYQPILVVEDDPMNQKVILRQLDLLGLSADLAKNGAEALSMLEKARYGLILADLHMPVMDGYAMTAAIRSREAIDAVELARSISIVALTANVLSDEIGRTRKAGFDGFLTKPTTLVQLAETIAAFLPRVDAA